MLVYIIYTKKKKKCHALWFHHIEHYRSHRDVVIFDVYLIIIKGRIRHPKRILCAARRTHPYLGLGWVRWPFWHNQDLVGRWWRETRFPPLCVVLYPAAAFHCFSHKGAKVGGGWWGVWGWDRGGWDNYVCSDPAHCGPRSGLIEFITRHEWATQTRFD